MPKDRMVLNLGVGVGNLIYPGTGFTAKIPTLSASFEYCIIGHVFDDKSSIGIGGYFGFTGATYTAPAPSACQWNYTSWVLAPRGYFHYQFVDRLDTYACTTVGYEISVISSNGNCTDEAPSHPSTISWSGCLGVRFYFTPALAAMAEVGYGISYLNLGLAFSF